MLIVQSEFSGVDRSLASLQSAGFCTEIIAWQRIPFGPVLSAQAKWLQNIGRLRMECRKEYLFLIRADKP
jgi:release factor glutamine methyltransferase